MIIHPLTSRKLASCKATSAQLMRAASSLEFTRCAPDLSGLAALRNSLLYVNV